MNEDWEVMDPPTTLSEVGYRYDTLSYQEIIGEELHLSGYAYCGSIDCSRYANLVLKRHATPGIRRCPDCGSGLNWRRSLLECDKRKMIRETCEHNWFDVQLITKRRQLKHNCIECGIPYDPKIEHSRCGYMTMICHRWKGKTTWENIYNTEKFCKSCGISETNWKKGWSYWDIDPKKLKEKMNK